MGLARYGRGPQHLGEGERVVRKKATRDGPEKCIHGHRYDEKNTYRHKGKKFCRKCHAAGQRARRRRGAA